MKQIFDLFRLYIIELLLLYYGVNYIVQLPYNKDIMFINGTHLISMQIVSKKCIFWSILKYHLWEKFET